MRRELAQRSDSNLSVMNFEALELFEGVASRVHRVEGVSGNAVASRLRTMTHGTCK